MHVIQCTETYLDAAGALFDEYRVFYGKPSNIEACQNFIRKNFEENRSRLFLTLDVLESPVGFCQLYHAICSLEMRAYYYISDLYIKNSARKKGYATYLMNHIKQHFSNEDAQRLTLETSNTNKAARSLYESLGYKKEEEFITYNLTLR